MVLQNYVILQSGLPTRLHFRGHVIQARTITDPLTQRAKTVNALVFEVDTLDGRAVNAFYSTISDKHSKDFAPYLEGNRYVAYDFIITQLGEGFRREYQVQILARP